MFDGCDPETRICACQNPADGTGHSKDGAAAWRHALIEREEILVDEWVRIMRELDLLIAALAMSGGISVHTVVRIEANGTSHYEERVRLSHKPCDAIKAQG